LAAGVTAGDEVVTVSHSFIASANVIRYCGAIPVFVDIELSTFNMDPKLLEAAISSRTRAILCVHQIGMPCNLEEILRVAQQHGLKVIEDAACAAGSEIVINDKWQRIGRPHGHLCCFSFHPRKVITTGDGGMITTADKDVDNLLRLLRQHGMSVSDSVRHQSNRIIFEDYRTVGYNYRLTDIQAAVGREQLKKLSAIVDERRQLAEQYRTLLKPIEDLGLPVDSNWTRSNWQSYCVLLPPQADQRAIMQYMLDVGVATRRGVMCSHREPCYKDLHLRFALPNSEAAQDRGILLPMYQGMTLEDQRRVAATLKEALAQ
jgi:perosamine synthetase